MASLFIYTSSALAGELLFQIDDLGPVFLGSKEYQPLESFKYVLVPLVVIDPDGNFKASLREFYVDWQTGKFGLSAGRRLITYGPGRYGYPMLGPLCRELRSEGYDQAGYNFSWGNLKYQKFYALIPEDSFRGLLGQRATFDWGNFTFGVSETAVVNESAPLFYYNPLPFIPIYFDQFLGIRVYKISKINDAANVNIDADVAWQITPEIRVYGEYYADDRPGLKFFQHNDLETSKPWENPWRVGYQAGMEWERAFGQPDLVFYSEYTRIDQFTYTGLNQELSYTFAGRAMGDPLGPDADRLNLELVFNKTARSQWGIAWKRERHGEGKLGDVWHAVPGQTEVFLTGVVETTDEIAVTLTREMGVVKLSATLGVEQINNFNHISNKTQSGLKFKIVGVYCF
jgi:hypothetical protein